MLRPSSGTDPPSPIMFLSYLGNRANYCLKPQIETNSYYVTIQRFSGLRELDRVRELEGRNNSMLCSGMPSRVNCGLDDILPSVSKVLKKTTTKKV